VAFRAGIPVEAFHALIDSVRLFGIGYSWGGFESLILPCYPERSVAPPPFAGRLLRISAGMEAPEDLIEDLQDGFVRLRAGRA